MGAERNGTQLPTGPKLSDLLRTRLRELGALVERRGERALASSELTLPLNHLLDAVVAEPGVTVTTIAQRLGKSQQAISLAANRLETLGFVERRVGSGRSVGLHPTGPGEVASADGVRRELGSELELRTVLGGDTFDLLVNLVETARDRLAADLD